MTNKVFVTYLPTGEVVGITSEDEVFFELRRARGELLLETNFYTDHRFLKVDVATMKVVQKSSEELEAEGIVLPDFKGPWVQ